MKVLQVIKVACDAERFAMCARTPFAGDRWKQKNINDIKWNPDAVGLHPMHGLYK